jgi:hypothetical protein
VTDRRAARYIGFAPGWRARPTVVGAFVIEFELPAPELEELTLVSDVEVRGTRSGAGEPLKGRVSVGGPHGFAITAERVAADPEIAQFVEENSSRRAFYLVWLTASFTALGSPRLESAQVGLTLTTAPADPAPFALDMKPLVVGDTVSVEGTLSFGPKLKILEVEAEAGAASRKTTVPRSDLSVRGLGLDSASPTWQFTETASRKIEGASRLVLVVQAAAGATLTVAGDVTADTSWGNIPWPFRGKLPGPLRFQAEIG